MFITNSTHAYLHPPRRTHTHTHTHRHTQTHTPLILVTTVQHFHAYLMQRSCIAYAKKISRWSSIFCYVRCNKNSSKNVTCSRKKNCCIKQIFLNVVSWRHSMKRFRHAKLLSANHKTCLKRSIFQRMFDFKNGRKQFSFKNNIA